MLKTFLSFMLLTNIAFSATFYSPAGNPEVWPEKPPGYITVEEWLAENPTPEPVPMTDEEKAILTASIAIQDALTKNIVEYYPDFTDEEISALGVSGLLDDWKTGKKYSIGKRLFHDGQAYVVMVEVAQSLANQPPGAMGMLTVYRPVNADANVNGTIDAPIVFVSGMDVTEGLYYSHAGATYLAKANMPACVWDPGTAGLWQWEIVE